MELIICSEGLVSNPCVRSSFFFKFGTILIGLILKVVSLLLKITFVLFRDLFAFWFFRHAFEAFQALYLWLIFPYLM